MPTQWAILCATFNIYVIMATSLFIFLYLEEELSRLDRLSSV